MRRFYLAKALAVLTAVLLLAPLACAKGSADKADNSIFSLLMPGRDPDGQISLPNPPQNLRDLLKPLVTDVRKVDLWSYTVKEVTPEELLKGFENKLVEQGWNRRVANRVGRGFDAVFMSDSTGGPFQVMLIEIRRQGAQRRVTFTKIIGSKSGGSASLQAPVVLRTAPFSATSLMITASGPSLQYEAWARNEVEVQKLQPTGQFSMPEITTEGSRMRVVLLPAVMNSQQQTQQAQQFSFPLGLDYMAHGPKRLAIEIRSMGSPVTISLNGIKQLTVDANNGPVTIVGSLPEGSHSVKAVNQRVVLNLERIKCGELKVNVTNGEIAAVLPQSSSVQLTASAVGGTVSVKGPGPQMRTDNPATFTLGSGLARLILESIGGTISVKLK